MSLKNVFFRFSVAKKKKKAVKKKKKVFQLAWVYEDLEAEPSFFTKRMFGGLAVYCHGKMVMLLAESPGDREYRGQTFDFDIWNGILLPTEYAHHDRLKKKWAILKQHPVLKKWLYLPQDTDAFDSAIDDIVTAIHRDDPLLGIFPKST